MSTRFAFCSWQSFLSPRRTAGSRRPASGQRVGCEFENERESRTHTTTSALPPEPLWDGRAAHLSTTFGMEDKMGVTYDQYDAGTPLLAVVTASDDTQGPQPTHGHHRAYPRRWWILFLLSVTSMHQVRPCRHACCGHACILGRAWAKVCGRGHLSRSATTGFAAEVCRHY